MACQGFCFRDELCSQPLDPGLLPREVIELVGIYGWNISGLKMLIYEIICNIHNYPHWFFLSLIIVSLCHFEIFKSEDLALHNFL